MENIKGNMDRFDELVQVLDERLDHFTKMFELHKEIEYQNEEHLRKWKKEGQRR